MEPRQLVIQALESNKLAWGLGGVLWDYKIEEADTPSYLHEIEISVQIDKGPKIVIYRNITGISPTKDSFHYTDRVNQIWLSTAEYLITAGISKIYERSIQLQRDRVGYLSEAIDYNKMYPMRPSDCIEK